MISDNNQGAQHIHSKKHIQKNDIDRRFITEFKIFYDKNTIFGCQLYKYHQKAIVYLLFIIFIIIYYLHLILIKKHK